MCGKRGVVGNALLLFQVSRRRETAVISGADKREVDFVDKYCYLLWEIFGTFV